MSQEFEIDGRRYRAGTMDAMTQFHVVRRLAPVLSTFRSLMDGKLEDGFSVIADAISKMSDSETEYVIGSCMAVVQREEANGGGWANVWNRQAKQSMFTDINMGVMLKIVFAVLKDAIGPFFSALPQK